MFEAILMLTGVLVVLAIVKLRSSYREKNDGWKVRNTGNSIQYSEVDDRNNWRSVNFICDRYAKDVPRHSIIIPSDWSDYPEWAQERRDDIILRLKQRFKAPAYTFIEK